MFGKVSEHCFTAKEVFISSTAIAFSTSELRPPSFFMALCKNPSFRQTTRALTDGHLRAMSGVTFVVV